MGVETSARNETPAEAAPEPGERPRKVQGSAPYSVPTQLIILALVAVLVVPGIAFAGLLLARYAHSERVRYELESVDVARAASTALDRYLNGLQTTLQTLSTSAFLAAGDLEGFHQQAERIKSFIGADIGLRRPDGQQLVNTRLPWGAALPPTPLAVDAQVIATGKPLVSDVFTGIVANRPLVAIILPVTSAVSLSICCTSAPKPIVSTTLSRASCQTTGSSASAIAGAPTSPAPKTTASSPASREFPRSWLARRLLKEHSSERTRTAKKFWSATPIWRSPTGLSPRISSSR